MSEQDYVNILAAIGAVLGAVGGIPQLLRWFGNRPKLSVDTVNLWYTELANSATFYTYLEDNQAHSVPAQFLDYLSCRKCENQTRILRML